jgi:DNA-binding SARP family transcriptional activator
MLLCTALLPTMTATDAALLSGEVEAGRILADLHGRNCFVVQRGLAPPIFEFHALFRAFLLNRAASVIPAADWRELQCSAADMLATRGQPDAAASLYHSAQHWNGLAALALRDAAALVKQGRHRTLERWLGGLPTSCYSQAPWLYYWRAAACLPFDPVAARKLYEQAYEGFRCVDDAAGLYSAWTGVMETFFFEWRDFRPADPWILEFERLRARHPVFPTRSVELLTYWAMGTLLHRQPQHPTLPSWAERAKELLDPADRELSVLLGGYLIIWFLWVGDCAKASSTIERISCWISPDMPPMVQILWSCAVALYHSARGECAACQSAVDAGMALAERTGLHTFDFLLSAQMARCNLVAGHPTRANEWLSRMAGTMRNHSHIDGAFYLHLRCNAAAQCGEPQLALEHARNAMAMAEESGVPFLLAHCHLDLAHLLPGYGDEAECAQHVGAARAIGQSMGSRVIEYLCLEADAHAAFRQGQVESGQRCIAAALALSQAMDGATYQVSGPRASAALYERALATGLSVTHVQDLIRRRGIAPDDPATTPDFWPWPIRVYTLGRFDLLRDGEPLRSDGKAQRKPLELLKCVCAFGGQAVHQDRVADALWPDASGETADQTLRTTLHRLRKLLRNEQAVRLDDRHLSLDTRYVWVDSLLFDRASHMPQAADTAGLKRALRRYRGPFLPGESAPWAMACQHRLRARFIGMVEMLGTLLEQNGEWGEAAECYVAAIEAEPLAELAYRRLMAAYAHLGRRAEALLVYQRCRLQLLSGLGVSPGQQTQALYSELAES